MFKKLQCNYITHSLSPLIKLTFSYEHVNRNKSSLSLTQTAMNSGREFQGKVVKGQAHLCVFPPCSSTSAQVSPLAEVGRCRSYTYLANTAPQMFTISCKRVRECLADRTGAMCKLKHVVLPVCKLFGSMMAAGLPHCV